MDGKPVLDLCYEEDSRAEADFNFVMTHEGQILEIQGGAEQRPLAKERFDECYALAEKGVSQLAGLQNSALIADLGQ